MPFLSPLPIESASGPAGSSRLPPEIASSSAAVRPPRQLAAFICCRVRRRTVNAVWIEVRRRRVCESEACRPNPLDDAHRRRQQGASAFNPASLFHLPAVRFTDLNPSTALVPELAAG